MSGEAYEEGDFIRIRDIQAANATIGLKGEISRGKVVKIINKRGDFLVCKSIEPPEAAPVKPFPIDADDPITGASGDDGNCRGRGRKVLSGDEEDLASDVSKFLSDQTDLTSDSIK